MPKSSADRQWVNREDRADRAWPRDHLQSRGARAPLPAAQKPPASPDEDATAAPERQADDGSGATAGATVDGSKPIPS